MSQTLLVLFGGAIGSALRYHVGRLGAWLIGPNAAWGGWPWGTLAVNVVGGLAMGLLAGWLAARAQGGENLRLFVGVGLLGGFTTFSAFCLDTMLMIERGAFTGAIGYVLLSVTASIAALALGLQLARMAA